MRPAGGGGRFEQGDIVATGTIYADGYRTTSVQRGQFIVTTIRDYLRRKACVRRIPVRMNELSVAGDTNGAPPIAALFRRVMERQPRTGPRAVARIDADLGEAGTSCAATGLDPGGKGSCASILRRAIVDELTDAWSTPLWSSRADASHGLFTGRARARRPSPCQASTELSSVVA
jgi:hypothetical protein